MCVRGRGGRAAAGVWWGRAHRPWWAGGAGGQRRADFSVESSSRARVVFTGGSLSVEIDETNDGAWTSCATVSVPFDEVRSGGGAEPVRREYERGRGGEVHAASGAATRPGDAPLFPDSSADCSLRRLGGWSVGRLVGG